MNETKVMKTKVKGIAMGLFGLSIAFSGVLGPTLDFAPGTDSKSVYAAEKTTKFKDVAADSYALDAILDLTERGIIAGYPNNQFKPAETVTRGQFAAFLARYLNLPAAESNFKDLPKSKSLYKDVSRAAKAGIIKGDANGLVKAEQIVSRADIAVMVDRAMQLKGKFNETVELEFKDNGSVPAYALESVKKMTRYGIIQGKGNNTFAPSEYADRAVSAVFVYRMVNIIEGKTKVPEIEKPSTGKPDYYSWTYEKMVKEFGEHKFLVRNATSGRIIEFDAVKDTYDLYQLEGSHALEHPKERLKARIDGMSRIDTSMYPQSGVIAYNGKAIKDTDIYKNTKDESLDKVLPTHPKQTGQFLIDIYSFSTDFTTYTSNNVLVGNLKDKPVPYGENDYIMNLDGVFNNVTGFKFSKGGSEITFGNKKIVLSNGSKKMLVNGKAQTLTTAAVLKNGSYYAPVREVAEALGLSARKVVSGIGYYNGFTQIGDQYKPNFGYRLEIANYNLPLEEGIWK